MKIGVIADDFTGATDIAGFLVAGGLTTTQMIGVPDADAQVDADAVVISLKSRSNPAAEAVADSLAALEDEQLAMPQRLVLISPMIGVTSYARYAGLAALLDWLRGQGLAQQAAQVEQALAMFDLDRAAELLEAVAAQP